MLSGVAHIYFIIESKIEISVDIFSFRFGAMIEI